jgi:hypothetical protein
MNVRVITAQMVLDCPKISLAVGHYREDGTCECMCDRCRKEKATTVIFDGPSLVPRCPDCAEQDSTSPGV